jgi:hypothetical protein
MYERRVRDDSERPHPIWRGLGFLIMAVVAIMSYAGANLLVEANKTKGWVRVPAEIQGGVSWAPDLYAELVVAFFLMFIGFGVLTIVYSIVYRITRPKDLYKMVK